MVFQYQCASDCIWYFIQFISSDWSRYLKPIFCRFCSLIYKKTLN